ncbi:GAF domain-containing protein [Nocardioides mesophilus]|uniref:GAF domain-containing protein n=1 Tax=Nocardioides mesophilus TaxID=433659 RepID=A0A7G9RET6_9ACTN|nr:GAF domain-containing protein [Nocardioides mesophilus]QNN54111.1 GAF domain-containing protein [Nocardioides mesophilus]
MEGASAARLWLVNRVDRRLRDGLRDLLDVLVEELAVVTADAVALRGLSADGRRLVPLAAHHPDVEVQAALLAAMEETTEVGSSGIWQRVMAERTPQRWELAAGDPPPETPATRLGFLAQYPIRAVLAAPMIARGQLLGGVIVIRLVNDRPFSEDDEALVCAFADRAALGVDCLRTLGGFEAES